MAKKKDGSNEPEIRTTYAYLDNYRGFSNAVIPINHVNFLVGENSTGKSSFLDFLRVVGRMPFWLFDAAFTAAGSASRHFLDLVSASSSDLSSFTIGVVGCTETCDLWQGMVVTYREFEGRASPSRISIVDGEMIHTVDHPSLTLEGAGRVYRARHAQLRFNGEKDRDFSPVFEMVNIHGRDGDWETKELDSRWTDAPSLLRYRETLFPAGNGHARPLPSFLSGDVVVSLAPIRAKPKRTYDAPQTEFSPEGDHIPYRIQRYLGALRKFDRYLRRFGKDSGLFHSVGIKPYGKDPRSPFEIGISLESSTQLSIENVGYGVSQALPILVEMFTHEKGTTFCIQQPEVHLHPRAQAELGDMIANFARKEQKGFFIETHSDFLIDRFRLNVRRNGAIESQVLFFERKGGTNTATSIPIAANGDLSSEQPDSYRDFFLNESIALLS